MKPVVLIPLSNVANESLVTVTGDTALLYSDRLSAEAIRSAGGLPVFVPTFGEPDYAALQQYVDMAAGLFLPGEDTSTDPHMFGESDSHTPGRIDYDRDRTDIELVKLAYQRQIPILGICKGMQIINVAMGGTLHQDVTSQHASDVEHDVRGKRTSYTHDATLTKDSILGKIYKSDTIHLNGGHQQAVKQLSEQLRSVATASDEIVEAFEGVNYPFLLGTQFHAELRQSDPAAATIFTAFIAATRK